MGGMAPLAGTGAALGVGEGTVHLVSPVEGLREGRDQPVLGRRVGVFHHVSHLPGTQHADDVIGVAPLADDAGLAQAVGGGVWVVIGGEVRSVLGVVDFQDGNGRAP